ncbi:hypothetical protein QBC37DRAFT_164300 [Rhypophila decipiens]|uniref:Uncharacterized protein n=1 Tax=Rhypophila decipiens TaxID=261697 RepID=A0AAN7BAD3_9PEZI|nr:hypothetical protein QBC37DRAFT_164300 [Rhypophila decipiens]
MEKRVNEKLVRKMMKLYLQIRVFDSQRIPQIRNTARSNMPRHEREEQNRPLWPLSYGSSTMQVSPPCLISAKWSPSFEPPVKFDSFGLLSLPLSEKIPRPKQGSPQIPLSHFSLAVFLGLLDPFLVSCSRSSPRPYFLGLQLFFTIIPHLFGSHLFLFISFRVSF